MSKARLLIVHPEPSALALLTSMLRSLDHVIEEAANDRVAARLLERGGVDLVLAGVDPVDPEGLELLSYMRRKHRQLPLILLLTAPHPERAKEALRQGALTVLRYPIPATELRAAVTQALGPLRLSTAPAPAAQAAPGAPFLPGPAPAPPKAEQSARELGLVGNDPNLRQVVELAATIAATRSPALLLGERGTGKAVLARAVHQWSGRADLPFVALDCAALAETLLASEPYEPVTPQEPPGAPPAEWSTKLAEAHGGTLFLDDVASLPESLQGHLQRALQSDGHATNGSHHGGLAETRFLMSTPENLQALVEQGKFRQDLYHRISVLCLKLPPLRHRGGDVELLAEHFRARFSQEFRKNVVGFTSDALDVLRKHDWPGNVQELEGVIQRGVALCQGARITSGHLSPSLGHTRPARSGGKSSRSHPLNIRPLKEALEEPEKRIIIQALQALNWNRQETARVLDINRTTLYKKMKKYGLLVDGPIWVN